MISCKNINLNLKFQIIFIIKLTNSYSYFWVKFELKVLIIKYLLKLYLTNLLYLVKEFEQWHHKIDENLSYFKNTWIFGFLLWNSSILIILKIFNYIN